MSDETVNQRLGADAAETAAGGRSPRFPEGKVSRPANPAHRRDMCVDAVAELDMTALYQLVCRHHATVEDITAAAEQTDRTADEISAALAAWVLTDAADGLTPCETGRLVTTLTQPSLTSLMER